MTISNNRPAHFLELPDFTSAELNAMLDVAQARKQKKPDDAPLKGKRIVGIFDKSSVRTVESFICGIDELGGMGRERDFVKLGIPEQESAEHVVKTLSQYFHGIVLRVSAPEMLDQFAAHATVPVINGMTDRSHPCQLMADMLTIRERLGDPAGKKVVFAGDVLNNMANTYQQAASLFGFELTLTGPGRLLADMPKLQPNVRATADMASAVKGADVVVTDVWRSKGQSAKDEAEFAPYQVNGRVMDLARPSAIFMHCMPVSPCYTKEVTADVLRSPQSVIIQQAGNRMHAQNAILLRCLNAA